MHAVDDRPRATLRTAQQALYSAARRPFDDRLRDSCLIVQSAALRLQVELAEGSVLSLDSSAFTPFAQMSAWLAHLVVTAQLPPDVRPEVLAAFKKLAAACEQLGKSTPRLATRRASAGSRCPLRWWCARRRKNGASFAPDALEGLARVCVQKAMAESQPLADWSPNFIAVLASAFAAADVPHEGLFKRVGALAERFSSMGKQWKTEDLLKLLHAAFALKQLKSLERFLRGLQADRGLEKLLKEATPRDLPMLFDVLAVIKASQLLVEVCRSQKDKLKGEKLPALVAILKDSEGGLPPGLWDAPRGAVLQVDRAAGGRGQGGPQGPLRGRAAAARGPGGGRRQGHQPPGRAVLVPGAADLPVVRGRLGVEGHPRRHDGRAGPLPRRRRGGAAAGGVLRHQ
ncbi:unnamed protein product, partial [Prorocentrum cordatum]